MFRSRAAATSVWVMVAIGGAFSGCTGSGERLPECRGIAVPINPRVETAPASHAKPSGVRAYSGTLAAGANDGE